MTPNEQRPGGEPGRESMSATAGSLPRLSDAELRVRWKQLAADLATACGASCIDSTNSPRPSACGSWKARRTPTAS